MAADHDSVQRLENRAFLFIVILTTLAFLWIVRGFLMPVFWASVLAVLFQPVFRRWLAVFRGRASWAAVMTTLSVIVIILIPTGLLGAAVTQQALSLYQRIASGEVDLQAPIAFVERSLPAVTELLSDYGVDTAQLRESLEQAAVRASQYVATQAFLIGRDTLLFTALFFLTLYFLFFFVRDWETVITGVIRSLPLGDERERRLFAKFAEVSRATIKGTLVVALVQGLLGGLLFGILGIEAAVFWGVVMGVLSFLPAIGPPLVWIPAAVILIATGSIWKGIIIIVFGTLVIGLADNVLRPILVGRDTRMPDYLVLLTTLGGLARFGLAGVIIGPLIAGLFLVVWEIMAEEYGHRGSVSVGGVHLPEGTPTQPN